MGADDDRAAQYDEYERKAFERRRDWRSEDIALEHRMARVAVTQINRWFGTMLCVGAVIYFSLTYGWLGFAGAAVGAGLIAAYFDYEGRRRPGHQWDEIDRLAEDVVAHERILQLEAEGKEWMRLDKLGWEWDLMFDPPYYKQLNAKVRAYELMSHKDRLRDQRLAQKASLPARLRMEDHLKKSERSAELPWFARIEDDERPGAGR